MVFATAVYCLHSVVWPVAAVALARGIYGAYGLISALGMAQIDRGATRPVQKHRSRFGQKSYTQNPVFYLA